MPLAPRLLLMLLSCEPLHVVRGVSTPGSESAFMADKRIRQSPSGGGTMRKRQVTLIEKFVGDAGPKTSVSKSLWLIALALVAGAIWGLIATPLRHKTGNE
jgi:hypothetical protein